MIIDALACYRLVKLVRDDRITQPVRQAVIDRQGPPEKSKVSYLLDCPWCLSVYFGAVLTLGRRRWRTGVDALARTLALSAAAGLATQYLDQD
ncbi:hypothetical protein HNR19_002318 [Nocardioides thalensis]|uniref:DUF1360 domain-containing protein n=1 Tax=Nocardioides thalensis TaxID=1914755 RepID=A0A853C063_9ACTN|nr:DUF1360 domain-containing protein [Nocardioides thalensis]NYJ01620.1 hypothetical protein [Nocardioides thalensis]